MYRYVNMYNDVHDYVVTYLYTSMFNTAQHPRPGPRKKSRSRPGAHRLQAADRPLIALARMTSAR